MSTNYSSGHYNQLGVLNPLAWQDIFIQEYSNSKNMRKAASLAGISRPTVYKYLQMDADFRQRFEHAREDAIDSLELSAFERARDGVTKITPLLYKGEVVAEKVETTYSDHLAEFFLTKLRPEVYGQSQKIDVTITDNRDDLKRFLTAAVQDGINAGLTLEASVKFLQSMGVKAEHLMLVDGSDLKMSTQSNDVIDITDDSFERNDAEEQDDNE